MKGIWAVPVIASILILGTIVAVIPLQPVQAVGVITLDFDSIDTTATGVATLSNEFQCQGVIFSEVTSGGPLTVVRDGLFGNGAVSLPNSVAYGFQGSVARATFVDPITGNPAVADFVSAQVGDKSGEVDPITMTAYGLDGQVLGTSTFTSLFSGHFGGVSISTPGIHRVEFSDSDPSGADFDDFTYNLVSGSEPESEGIPGLVSSHKDVQFKTVSDGTLDQDFGRGEKIDFRIYTYVDSDAVSNVRLLIASEGSEFSENPDVFINGNYLGKLANAFDDTTFEIEDKSFVNWKTENNLAGENLIEVSLSDCNTVDSMENIDWGGIFAEQRHIIFVPGVGGTELKNPADMDGTNGLEWIDVTQYVGDDDIEDLALNKKGTRPAHGNWNIFPGDIIREAFFGIIGVYVDYFDFLESRGYYSEKTFNEYKDGVSNFLLVTPYPTSNLRLHEFPYDWRLDNTVHANRLGVLINDLTAQPGGWDKVILTAHSMGGLITKKYISQTNGDDVEILFTMGTPYYGAVEPYKFFKIGDDFGIFTLEDKTLLELVRNWPSVYQLLATQKYFDSPLTMNPYGFLDFDAGGKTGIITIGDPSLREVYLDDRTSKVPNKKLMEKAIEFHEDMGDGFFNVENVYIATGIGVDTIVHVDIGGSRHSPEYVFIHNNFGDGTVPTTSGEAMLEGTENIERRSFSGAIHGNIPSEDRVQDWLWEIISDLNNNP